MLWVLTLAVAAALALIELQRRRHVRAIERLELMVAELNKDTAGTQRAYTAASERTDGIVRLVNENRAGIQEVKDRIGVVRSDLEAERDRLVETRQNLERFRLGHRGAALREHGDTALVLRESRRMSRLEHVDRVLLLVTIHRSASTTLFDVLRGHPEVFIEPSATLWAQFGLTGRRYPLDLCNGPTADIAIEVQPGVGALVPDALGEPGKSSIAIEKAHPQFFDFDADRLADQLQVLDESTPYEIELVYGIREPRAAMWSMIEYQQRNPQWYEFLGPDAVPEFIERSIRSIEALHHRRPGVILDYTDVATGSPKLRALFERLGSTAISSTAFDEAHRAFAPEERAKVQRGRFVGEGSTERPAEGPNGAWIDAVDAIDRAERAYGRLTSQQQGVDAP